jgi:RNA polymerase sigma factor (sigma-70 family)
MDKIEKEVAHQLYKQHATYVFRTALFLTKSKTLAEDITQETFIQIFKKYHTYNQSKPIKPWIYTITLNITRNMLRKKKWLLFGNLLNQYVKEANETTETTILKNEEEKELWYKIDRLPKKSKEVIVLHYYVGLKITEVSEVIKIPLGTCKSRLNTALTILRKELPKNKFLIKYEGEENSESI